MTQNAQQKISTVSVLTFNLLFLAVLFSSKSRELVSIDCIPPYILFLLGAILYQGLSPLHELGHFLVGNYYIKKNNYPMRLVLRPTKTLANDWHYFSEKERVLFLLAGCISKILYCIFWSLIFMSTYHYDFSSIFTITTGLEIILNFIPKFGEDSDICLIIDKAKFYSTDIALNKDHSSFVFYILWGVAFVIMNLCFIFWCIN